MSANDKFYLVLLYLTINLRSGSTIECFVSKINVLDGSESGMSRQKCPENTICALAEEIEDTTNKRSKFRDCLNEKMCQLLELKCQFCDTDFCVPEATKEVQHNSSSDNVNCVQCNTRNDSYCLTKSSPVLPCSKGEVCVTFSVTNFDGKNELERGCSNKEVCKHIGDFCSWCGSDGCLPRMPKIMYIRNPRFSGGSRNQVNCVGFLVVVASMHIVFGLF